MNPINSPNSYRCQIVQDQKKDILFIGIMIIITASFGSPVVTPFAAASPQMTALEIT
jgi:hypothetical protein